MLGLGFSSILSPDTPLDNLQNQGNLPDRTFSIYLSDSTVDTTSELIIGGFDPSHMLSSGFTYYELSTDDSWALSLSSVTFGSTTFQSSSSAEFDSRASAITASRDDFDNLLSAAQSIDPSCNSGSIGDITAIICGCNNFTQFPPLTLQFGSDNTQYIIRDDQYFYQDNGNCVIDIAKAGFLDDSWGLGHQFMKNYYTYYDIDNTRMGIAPANQPSS